MIDNLEEERFRDAALKNVEAILSARQRAEREMLQAKHSLEKESQWLEVTLASIGDGVIATDVKGMVTFINPAAERMIAARLLLVHGAPIRDVMHVINEDLRAPVDCPTTRALEFGRTVELPDRAALVAADGMETSIEGTAAPILDHQGMTMGAVMVFRDVGRRRRAERALTASEERLNAIFSQATLGIGVTSLEGLIHEANYKFCSILGYSLEELREMTITELTHPDDRNKTLDEVRRVLAGEIAHYKVDKRYRRKNGTFVWVNVTVALLRKEDGTASQFVGTIQDITERKTAEQILSRLAAVVEHSYDAIITKTLDGTITTWNPAAERIFGYAAHEMIGRPVTVLIPAEKLSEAEAILERMRRGDLVDPYETVRKRKNGTLVEISLTVSPIKNADGEVIGASKIARELCPDRRDRR